MQASSKPMNIAKTINQYDENCVYFCDSIHNTIMTDGLFMRILYSNAFMTLSGVYLIIHISNLTCEKYYNKYKCIFNPTDHNEMIQSVQEIESRLLVKSGIKNKTPQYKIHDLLKNGNIKIFHEISLRDKNNFILKISGVWETQHHYGLTYKFIHA